MEHVAALPLAISHPLSNQGDSPPEVTEENAIDRFITHFGNRHWTLSHTRWKSSS